MLTAEELQATTHVRQHTPWYKILYVQVIFAIVLGVLLGQFYPELGEKMKPLGDAFIKLVKMIIAPVIFITVVTGIAGMSNMRAVGRVAGKAMIYFLTFSTLALIIGLVVANTVKPGAGMNIDPATLDASKVSGYVSKAHDTTLTGFLMNIIPETLLSPLVGGDILQVLFVAICLAFRWHWWATKASPFLIFWRPCPRPCFAWWPC